MTASAFAQKDFHREWLIENVLLSGQPGVIGGPPKCLKTGILLDMAISIATGEDFLGHFKVAQKRRVAVISGESGEATIKETMLRICAAKGVALPECKIYLGFDLPRFSEDDDRDRLTEFLRLARVKVVFIDPLYLCLCVGDRPISPTNLYEVGPVLKRMTDACLAAGAAPIFVHHMTKSASKSKKEAALGLSDLAYAGISEFVRQWTLVNRRAPYDPTSGYHQLQMVSGGSGGHSGQWDVDIREGTLRSDFTGRYWDAQVNSPEDSGPFND